ncbi:Protein CBG26585 [Caenorhabditis briggsae]|uniref:Protein CBG26585 n=1 Tax=Caenorhabditis briggsae TaxID=6238 RepID=B6IIE5_CAEBR|nr:Protein CBG26585 [Caenorhabditis briggsae]CAR99675.1 Protein CBG26585 [Caenorhabditis briggsae]
MMTEGVQPTGEIAVRRVEPLAIEISGEPRVDSVDAFCDRYCSENMETKTKIYISLLLILPSLIYFLVSINLSHPKRSHVELQHFEAPLILNITTFSEDSFSAVEYAEAFDIAVKESIRRYVSAASSTRRELDDESTVALLRRS